MSRYAAAHPDVSRLAYDPLMIGAAIITVITATSVIFEIVGPVLTKIGLAKAGEIGKQDHV